MSISNNLYPPIINTYMPSFIRSDVCRVYFSLSDFNKFDDVKNNVQVVVNDKNTNQSVLNPSTYPAGIKITTLQEDKSINGNMRYFIEILPHDLKISGENDYNYKAKRFEINRFYKVQIRFTSSAVASYNPETDKISKWMIDNQALFSEWSSVCLIRGIEKPILTIRGFEENVQNKEIIFTSETIQLVGNVQFTNPSGEMTEFLDSATVKLFKKEEGEQSGKSYPVSIQQDTTSSKSEFNYTFKEAIEDGVSYVIKFTYTTNGGYQESKTYTFKVIQYGIDKINANIFATADDAEGRIKVEVKGLETIKEDFIGKITIRRTSSESNFSEWEDVHNALLTEAKELDYTWYDYTVKSGVWYKYCVQKRNRRNDRGVIVQTKEPVMVYFEDIFLTQGGRQLKLKFDTAVSSFKYNVLESRTDTLGSKYPFIRCNGHAKYRTFPISGLITSFCDEAGLFTTKKDIYGNTLELYEVYNKDNDITEYRDFSYEREFRERVMDFLYENNIKLFKSPTEGNILVRLMDINLTPNQTLGRMLYSFTATAYEMDDADVANFESYNIQTIGELAEGAIQQTEDRLGKITINKYSSSGYQVQSNFDEDAEDEKPYSYNNIIDIINQLNQYNGSIGFDNEIRKLKQIHLQFFSEPYLIKDNNGFLDFYDGSDNINKDLLINGYWIKINGKDIIIPAKSQYEKNKTRPERNNKNEIIERSYYRNETEQKTQNNGFTEPKVEEYASFELSNLDITSLEFKIPKINGRYVPFNIELSFIAEHVQTESLNSLVNKVYYYKKIGQLEGVFSPNHSIVRDLRIRYNETHKRGYSELIAVNGISIEAIPGTVVSVKDSLDHHYNQHEVSDTGFLDLDSISTTIDEYDIKGIRLLQAPFQENYSQLKPDQSDFLYKYPFLNDDKFYRIKDNHYVKQYNKYTYINNKIDTDRVYIETLPENPIKNGVYAQQVKIGEDNKKEPIYEYNYWIYYKDNWYPFDAEEEIVLCPVEALINYYCEVVEGEYD